MDRTIKILSAALFSSSCALGIWSCTAEKKQEVEETQKLSAQEKKVVEDYKAEVEIGRTMAGRLLAFYGSYADDSLLKYLNEVGNYMGQYSDYPSRRYMFAILDDESVNAFACPGGYILVTLGAVRHAKSEAELAGVLGHEVTHIGKQHMIRTLKGMKESDLDKAAAEESKRKIPDSVRVRRRPDPEDNVFASSVMKAISTATGGGLNVLKAAKAGMNVILEKGMDKTYELEADSEGTKYLIRAGYEPKAFGIFLSRLDKEKKKKAPDDKGVMEKTHPPFAERRIAIKQVLADMNANEIVGASGKKRFETYYSALPKKKDGGR